MGTHQFDSAKEATQSNEAHAAAQETAQKSSIWSLNRRQTLVAAEQSVIPPNSSFRGLSYELQSNGQPQTPPIQAKMKVGQSNDKYEKEADCVSEKIVSQTTQTTPDENTSENTTIQRMDASGLRTSAGEGSDVSPEIESSIQQAQGQGQLLPKSIRESSEKTLGEDLSNVRIHHDNKASKMSEALEAKAFTVGHDIFFNNGEYNPDSDPGKLLLAHELIHTIQQDSGNPKVPSLQKAGKKKSGENKGIVGRTKEYFSKSSDEHPWWERNSLWVYSLAMYFLTLSFLIQFNDLAGVTHPEVTTEETFNTVTGEFEVLKRTTKVNETDIENDGWARASIAFQFLAVTLFFVASTLRAQQGFKAPTVKQLITAVGDQLVRVIKEFKGNESQEDITKKAAIASDKIIKESSENEDENVQDEDYQAPEEVGNKIARDFVIDLPDIKNSSEENDE